MARIPVLALVLVLLLAATAALADAPAGPRARQARLRAVADLPAAPAPGAQAQPGLTPMQREIQAVLDTARVRREALLRATMAAAERPAALARLQRETRLRVLEIQERWARRDGRVELARRIRAAIDDLAPVVALDG